MKNEDLFFMYWDISTLFDDFLSCGRQDEIEQGDDRGVFPVMIIGMTGALLDKYYIMQQAARVSDNTVFFYMGDMMEFGDTVFSTLGQARQAFQKESPELATAMSARTICWTKSMLMPLPFCRLHQPASGEYTLLSEPGECVLRVGTFR